MSAFQWRNQPSILANADKKMRLPITKALPKPAQQISYSTKIPHSINTEPVAHGDKIHALKRGSISPRGAR